MELLVAVTTGRSNHDHIGERPVNEARIDDGPVPKLPRESVAVETILVSAIKVAIGPDGRPIGGSQQGVR